MGEFTGIYYVAFKEYIAFYRINENRMEIGRILFARSDYMKTLFGKRDYTFCHNGYHCRCQPICKMIKGWACVSMPSLFAVIRWYSLMFFIEEKALFTIRKSKKQRLFDFRMNRGALSENAGRFVIQNLFIFCKEVYFFCLGLCYEHSVERISVLPFG